MKFRVLNAGHSDESGRYYEPDSVIETSLPLDKMFVNKFEKVADEDKKPKATKKVTEALVEDNLEVPLIGPTVPLPDSTPEVVEELPSPFGVDVSGQFNAESVGLRVFRSEDGYTVVDCDEPNKPVNDAPLKNAKVTQKFVDRNAKA